MNDELVHDKVTPEDIEAAIMKVDYTVLQDGRTTICLLTLDNGFTVHGESICASISVFDPVKGQEIALRNAKEQVWKFLGFRLADRLSGHSLDFDQIHDPNTEYVLYEDDDTRRITLQATFSEAGKKIKFLFEPAPPPAVH